MLCKPGSRKVAGLPAIRGQHQDAGKLAVQLDPQLAVLGQRRLSQVPPAAEKVAELLDRHGLRLSELDLRRQSCEGIGVETDRKRRGPIDDCMGTIAAFFDCRVWGEMSEDTTLRYIFFGLPADVQAAVYLHDLIALAFATETAAFQATEIYRSTHSSRRRSATNSFQVGLARGIIRKLDTLRQARDVTGGSTNGRALVPIKESIIDGRWIAWA